jgi:hypothetical protein
MHLLDGVKGRDSGIPILRDGCILGGGTCFWSIGSYTVSAKLRPFRSCSSTA